MKKKLLIIVPLVMVVVIALYIGIGINKYPITTPFQFPDKAELKGMTGEERIEACSIPDKIIAQMSTDALLEAYLDYPLRLVPDSFEKYVRCFEWLRDNHHFGLAELLERKDLCKSIVKRYKSIELYRGPVDKSLDWQEREIVYKEQYEDIYRMKVLEFLSSQIDLDGIGNSKLALKKELERKYNEKRQLELYKGDQTESMYYYMLNIEKIMEHR